MPGLLSELGRAKHVNKRFPQAFLSDTFILFQTSKIRTGCGGGEGKSPAVNIAFFSVGTKRVEASDSMDKELTASPAADCHTAFCSAWASLTNLVVMVVLRWPAARVRFAIVGGRVMVRCSHLGVCFRMREDTLVLPS